MIRIRASADDIASSRFAISPAFELTGLLRLLAGAGRHRLPASRDARLRSRYREFAGDPRMRAVRALQPQGYGADFVAVAPRSLAQTWTEDLATIRATPLAMARTEIDNCLAYGAPPEPAALRVLRGERVVQDIADVLDLAWHRLLVDDWLRLRTRLERDVLFRTTELGRVGWAGAVDGLHHRVRWRSGAIEVTHTRKPSQSVVLDGHGLLLIPSVFVWPSVAVNIDGPWPKALIYPARGVGTLWEATDATGAPSRRALADLLGRSRAELLLALDEPASTTQLARTFSLAVGAVGDHLTVLRRAGLVTRTPSGRSVLYRITPLGAALITMDGAVAEPSGPQRR